MRSIQAGQIWRSLADGKERQVVGYHSDHGRGVALRLVEGKKLGRLSYHGRQTLEFRYEFVEWCPVMELARGRRRSPELFYIQNKGYCGNCLLFWRAGGSGYTCDLAEAGKFTKAEADKLCSSRPHQDFAWPVETVDAMAVRHCPQGDREKGQPA